MDEIDRKILRELKKDAKLTNAALSERLGLSLSACQRRVKALETSKVIRRYRADVDPAALNEGFVVFVAVNLDDFGRERTRTFQRQASLVPEIQEIHHIAGAYDYLLKVAVSDAQSYQAFHAEKLARIDGIKTVTSFVRMSAIK